MTKQKTPTKIYISYSRYDEEIAQRIAHDLTQSKFSVWIDTKSISAGDQWMSAIQQGLESSEAMVLLVSPESMSSQTVENEWQYFFDQSKTVIPVLVRPADLHFQLNRLQYVDLVKQNYEEAFTQIVMLLNQQIPTRLTPEAAYSQRAVLSDRLKKVPPEPAEPQPAKEKKVAAQPEPSLQALLAEASTHQKNNVFGRAVELYGKILLDRTNEEIRVQAVNALGELRAALGDLIQTLNDDPAPQVRKAAIRALAGFQSGDVNDALQIAAVADDNIEVRLYAELVDLYFQHPNQVATWLDTLTKTRNPALRSALNEAQLFANEMTKLVGHVFISYSRQEAESFTLDLVEKLRSKEKFRIWIDTNLKPGEESWRRAIEKAIQQCSLLVLILSPAVHESKWIGEEIAYAEQLHKDRMYVKYRQSILPFGMSSMQGLRNDLTFEDYPEEMLDALIEELKRRNIPRNL